MNTPAFTTCPICGESVNLRSSHDAAYTVFSCSGCGAYSLTNELVETLSQGGEPTPDPEVFRRWLSQQSVNDSLKTEGPLVTANTFDAIRKALH
jgi:hypothetical protein